MKDMNPDFKEKPAEIRLAWWELFDMSLTTPRVVQFSERTLTLRPKDGGDRLAKAACAGAGISVVNDPRQSHPSRKEATANLYPLFSLF